MERLTVRAVRATPVVVPLPRPLTTAAGSMPEAPLLLIDLETEQGVVGRSYLFGYQRFTLEPLRSLVESLGAMVVGDVVAPLELEASLRRRFTLFGDRGLAGMALSGIDMAVWDAVAVAAGLPLCELLGGTRRRVRAYLSLGMLRSEEAIRETQRAVDEGWSGMKIKIGWPTLEEDLEVVGEVRARMPEGMSLMVDFNQTLSVAEAVRRGAALDDEGLAWIEEPVRAADFEGAATVAAEIRTPVQIGENFMGVFDMDRAIAVGACDMVMPDPQHIGGVTGWLRAAAVAHAAGLPCSGHIFIEATAHLLAVTPTCDWLEWLDLASGVLARPFVAEGGFVTAPDVPGTGIEWDMAAVEKYRL